MAPHDCRTRPPLRQWLCATAGHLSSQGNGRELVARRAIGEEVALVLLPAPEAMDYYRRLGFDRIDNGFIIRRSR
ncbi:hypothetical protein D3C71_1955110 [compost metagenome]